MSIIVHKEPSVMVKFLAFACCAMLMPFGVVASESYVLVRPATAVASSAYSGRGVVKAIDGTGMRADGLTHDNSNTGLWMNNGNRSSDVLIITMGQNDSGEDVAQSFSRIKIFNCNWDGLTARGVKGFSVWYGDEKPTSTTIEAVQTAMTQLSVGKEELSQATGKNTYTGETFDLSSTYTAKYVAIVITSGYTAKWSSLSEIQFFNRVVEPGDPFLLAAGIAETQTGLSVTGVVGNAVSTVGYCALADDGEHIYQAFAAEPTEVDADFSLPVDTAGWVSQQNFLFYALAKNDAGVTSNRIGRVFVGGLPTDQNVWIAPATADDLHASVAANWSQGLPTTDGLPILFSSAFADSDVIWDTGVNGLPAAVPPISFSEYGHTFTVDSATPTVISAQPGASFTLRNIQIGSTQPTAVTFGAGEYTLTDSVMLNDGDAAGSSLALASGAAMSSDKGRFVATAGGVTVEQGASLDFKEGFSSGSSATRGSTTTIRGEATFAASAGDAFATYSDGSVVVVDGGTVTSKGDVDLNLAGASAKGSRVTVKNGGQMVNQRTYLHAYTSPLLVEVLSGGSFSVGGTGFYFGSNGEGNNSFSCDVVVSNATWTSSSICYMPRDVNGRHSHFTLVEDPGETATATFGTLSLAGLVNVGETGFRTDNSISVRGGTFTAGALTIGSTGATKDGTNSFSVARANSRVTFNSLKMYENSELRIALPAGGFIRSGETERNPSNPAVKVSGAASFDERSKIVVDASEVTKKGTYTVLTANSLSGFSTLEELTSRVVVKNAHLSAEPFVEGGAIKVRFRSGLVILLK